MKKSRGGPWEIKRYKIFNEGRALDWAKEEERKTVIGSYHVGHKKGIKRWQVECTSLPLLGITKVGLRYKADKMKWVYLKWGKPVEENLKARRNGYAGTGKLYNEGEYGP